MPASLGRMVGAARVAAVTLALGCTTLATNAQTLAAPAAGAAPNLTLQGEGTMRFFGLKVYDIRLWTGMQRFSHAEPFALELVYDMALKGRDIAERSVTEMRGIGIRDEIKLKRWGEEMARVFPDVKAGDALIGVSIPGKEARFYSRDKLIATIPDPEFARAFFDIWLSDKTSAPGVRSKLLGTQAK
jgi:hypothetical protein